MDREPTWIELVNSRKQRMYKKLTTKISAVRLKFRRYVRTGQEPLPRLGIESILPGCCI